MEDSAKSYIDNNHNEQFILYIKYIFAYLETLLKEEKEQRAIDSTEHNKKG